MNLVSLMDIFTILVFFLLVNSSSDSQQLPNARDITLPTSVSELAPKENIVLMVTDDQILLDGKRIMTTSAAAANEADILQPVEQALIQIANKLVVANEADGYPITIMGDEGLPYELFSRLLSTSRAANFTQISFAAIQTARDGGEE